MTYHNKFGNKWSKIAKQLEGRSAEAIRNHWNCRRNAITAKWKGRQAKEASAKPENSASPAWEQAPSSGVPPALTQAPYYTNKPSADVAGAEAAPKAATQKDPAEKIPEAPPSSAAKTTPAQPPAMYPSGESAADRSNWSRVSGNERAFSTDDIGAMPAPASNSTCVESQSLVLPFSYKQSGVSL